MEAIITEAQLQKIVDTNLMEQRKSEFQEKYDSMSNEAKEIFNELYESLYTDSKGTLSEAWYNTLGDVVGIFDPTGLVDIANGLSYLYQGDTFFGMLSMISAIPYVGDFAAKPVMLAGKGSKLIKNTDRALKLAKAGKAVEASKIIADAAKTDSTMAKLMGTVRRWAPKLKDIIDKIPGGKLSSGLRNTLKDWVALFEKVGAGTQKASAIARRAVKKPLTKTETINVLKQMQTAIKQDKRLLMGFGGDAAKGLKGLKNYKAGGVPRLFGNRATRSLMTRTKFWAGFLDWLGVANFVGPEDLKQKMGAAFDEKMNQYSQTSEAQQNWNEDFANVPDDTMGNDTMGNDMMDGGSQENETDWTKEIINKLVFGPITGSATL
jgi:hypothetical protein